MKKTLVALAALTAVMSGAATAATVEISGKVDAGFAYNIGDIDVSIDGQRDSGLNYHTFSLDSGNNSGSRFILKGSEDLGDGYKAVFYLENGFSLDTGSLGQGSRLFGREARLSLETPYGTISAGRMGALTAGMGTYDIFQASGDAFDGGWNYNLDMGNWAARDRFDNMLTLVTPTAAGFTGYLQYSFGTDGVTDKNWDDTDAVYNERNTQRYAAIGLTYANGPISAALVLDTVLRDHNAGNWTEDRASDKDAQSVSLAINYDFEVAKLFFAAQYGENEDINFFTGSFDSSFEYHPSKLINNGISADGWRVHVGAALPTSAGTFKAGAYYGSLDKSYGAEGDVEAESFNFVLSHEYPFSKRTYSYVGLSYKFAEFKASDATDKLELEENTFSAQFGLVHTF